jgi:hypothetical protein
VSSTANASRRRFRPALIISAATLAIHGPLLLNDGVYWDGYLIDSLVRARDWAGLRLAFEEAGAPARSFLHLALGHLPHYIFMYKLSAFVAILLLALGVWRLAVDAGRLTDAEGMWMAVLATAYPGYALHFELILVPRVIAYAAFVWAAWLGLRAGRSQASTAVVLYALAAVVFTGSFILPSFMTLYLGYIVLAAALGQRRALDVIAWLVPLVAGVAGLLFWRSTGAYVDYNAISLSPGQAATETLWFLRYAVYGAVNAALRTLLAEPLLACLALGAVAYGYHRVGTAESWRAGGVVLALGVLLFALAIGPYAVTGKHPLVDGWTSRHSQLVGLPLAIVIVAGAAMASRRGWMPGLARELVLTVVAVAFGVTMTKSYVEWQARWVKDRSVMANLAARPDTRQVSIFLLDDRFPLSPEPEYRSYEWSSMFRRIWDDQRHAAFYGELPLEDIVRSLSGPDLSRLNLRDVDPRGCEAALRIVPGAAARDSLTMAITYTYTRLVHPDRLPAYLASVTSIAIEARPVAGATSCATNSAAS